ncbi:hypothetical protein BH09MYX1_BH09MYX1_21620 [soil metagenome]
MKAKDLRERTAEDLKELEKTLVKDLFDSRFKNFTNRLDDTSALRKGRRELARVKTLLAESARKAAGGDVKPAAAPKEKAAPAKAAKAPAGKAPKTTKKPAKAAEKK